MDLFDLRLWPEFREAGGDCSEPAWVDQISIDSRRINSSQALFVPLKGIHYDGHLFIPSAIHSGARYVLAQKGWKLDICPENVTILYVDHPLKALQDIAHAYRKQLPVKIVAIAGSYGKTMVKDLLQAFLITSKKTAVSPESFNSQIGAALSLLTVSKEDEIALIEAGISEKYEMDRLAAMIAPDYSILTHIGKKHIATLGNMETIAGELVKVSAGLEASQWALLPNVSLLQCHLSQIKARPFFWNEPLPQLPHACALPSDHGRLKPYSIHFPDGSSFKGKTSFGFYYFLDLLNITIKAAWLLGISSKKIQEVLEDYAAEPMRTEIWRSPLGTTFINDTYCSDPQSVDRSLKHFDQSPPTSRKVFVFEGMRGKQSHCDADYRHVGKMIQKAHIDLLLLVGEHPYHALQEELKGKSFPSQIIRCSSHAEAISTLRRCIRSDDTILFKGERKNSLDLITEAFNDSICTNQCFINLAAIEANITTIRKKLPKSTRIMVMVKALAYGTNDIRISRFLATCGIDILGVSYVDEGVALKRSGASQEIFIINAALYEATKVVKWGLSVGVSEKGMIDALAGEAEKQHAKIKVHLHVDTGMSRFGCRPEEALEMARYILRFPSLDLNGVMTHFACADDPSQDGFTKKQAHCLDEVIQRLESEGISIPWKHAANSSGVMRFHFPQFNMVRIGLAVYGLYPSEATRNTLDLRLALSLVSRIVGINSCYEGETISYGRTYKVERQEQRIAVLPIGYFDGLHRNYSGKGSVIIREKKAAMIGKICMDFMMIDITEIPQAAIGDAVLIFGEDEHGQYLSPEELAQSGDSIIYELITCLGPRIQRIFIYEEALQLR